MLDAIGQAAQSNQQKFISAQADAADGPQQSAAATAQVAIVLPSLGTR